MRRLKLNGKWKRGRGSHAPKCGGKGPMPHYRKRGPGRKHRQGRRRLRA